MRPAPTRSDAAARPDAGAAALRTQRDALVAASTLRGGAFGRALADLLDRTLTALLDAAGLHGRVAILALGSYGRRALCPGSDVDVVLLHALKRRRAADVRALSEHLWYPLWDAGFVTGHATRTVKESLALAAAEPDTLTSLLEIRHVAGDADLTAELAAKGRVLAQRRSGDLLRTLAEGAVVRRVRPGAVAEMLEPDLKEGAGGLRDLQSLVWAGSALGDPGGYRVLEQRGYLGRADVGQLEQARDHLLTLRVELHRVNGGRSDLLALQDQDAVAARVGAADADALVRDLARTARAVSWITADCWDRVRHGLAGPAGRVVTRDRDLARGIVLRDGRVTLTSDEPPSALDVLEAAAAAAEEDAPFDRASLDRLGEMSDPTWDVWERAAFIRLLRAGARAVPVFEALDHAGVLVQILPEWEAVRSRPQRNAYHRFTVDRHLLEAVAQCAALLDAGDESSLDDAPIDAVIARACRRPEILSLAALLHDIGKGSGGDHSQVGARVAETVARRIGLDSEGREILVWLVRHHLLLAEVATRRDLSDPSVVARVVDTCAGDAERLRLLYLLTIGDSLATGPAAWSTTKAVLVLDLFVRAADLIEERTAEARADERREELEALIGTDRATRLLGVLPESYPRVFTAAQMAEHAHLLEARGVSVSARRESDDRIVVVVAAPDEPGLLATVAGALSVCGLSVDEAFLFSTTDGMALDVFGASDPFGRFDETGPETVSSTVTAALAGEIDVDARVAERTSAYRRPDRAPGPVEVTFDLEESDSATIVEVHADDEVGLLARVARAFADLGLDVSVAKVATLGERVVDVFYVRDPARGKIADPEMLARVERLLVERLRAP